MSDWGTVLASLIGVCLGGGITFLTNKQGLDREDARRRKEVLISKLERLYEALNDLDVHHKSLWGELASRFGTDAKLDVSKLRKNNLSDVEFLVEAFLPSARPHIKQIRCIQKDLGELTAEAVGSQLDDGNRKQFMLKTFDIDNKLSAEIDSIRSALYKVVREAHSE